MRHAALVLLAVGLAVLPAGCGTLQPQGDSWLGRDKAKHFGLSAVMAGAGAAAANAGEMDDHQAFPAVVGITLAIGAAKETYDLHYKPSGWSWKDLAWDLLGALAGFYAIEAMD
jgi:putative lipoprotein